MVTSLNLFENIKSVGDALTFMGLPAVPNPVDLKTAYRKLAMTMHPDQGGTDEQMKDLIASYSLLSKATPGGGGASPAQAKQSWDDRQAKQKEKNGRDYDAMLDLFNEAFDQHALLAYLARFIKEPLTVEIKTTTRQKALDSTYDAWFMGNVEVSNPDKTTVVYLSYSIHPETPKSNGLGGGDIDERDVLFSISTGTEIYFAKRKQKVGQRDWKWRAGAKAIEDFEEILPPARMKKIFSGATTKVFKRADMKLGLEKEVNADYQSSGTNEQFRFDICGYDIVRQKKGQSYVVLTRSVFMRTPVYAFQFIGTFNNLGKLIGQNIYAQSAYIEETEENLDKIVALIKQIRKDTEAYDERADGPMIFSVVKRDILRAFPK